MRPGPRCISESSSRFKSQISSNLKSQICNLNLSRLVGLASTLDPTYDYDSYVDHIKAIAGQRARTLSAQICCHSPSGPIPTVRGRKALENVHQGNPWTLRCHTPGANFRAIFAFFVLLFTALAASIISELPIQLSVAPNRCSPASFHVFITKQCALCHLWVLGSICVGRWNTERICVVFRVAGTVKPKTTCTSRLTFRAPRLASRRIRWGSTPAKAPSHRCFRSPDAK